MYSIKENIVLIKNDEFVPEDFWEKAGKIKYAPLTREWDLYYKGQYISTFKGKKNVIEYMKKNVDNTMSWAWLYSHYKSKGYEIIKREFS